MPRILGLSGTIPLGQETGSRPAKCKLAGFLFSSGASSKRAATGVLLFDSGQYNRSVLISAIRVHARGHGSALLPVSTRGHARGHGFGLLPRAARVTRGRADNAGAANGTTSTAHSPSPPWPSRAAC